MISSQVNTLAAGVAHTSEELHGILRLAIATPLKGMPGKPDCIWGLPLLIEGEPGIAKTARVHQWARVLEVTAKSLFAAQHPPEDFSGALIPTGDGEARQICPLQQVRELIKLGVGIIFLDELNGAAPATQGAIQSFIHERIAGDTPMPGRIRIIAAQNPADIATGGYVLSPPVANRFVHIYDPGPNADEWCKWLLGSTVEEEPSPIYALESIVADDWSTKYPAAQGLFIGFMQRHPSLLHQRPDLANDNCSKAWPSHRTWDYALRAWTTAQILQESDAVREATVIGCVGEGAARSLFEYYANSDLPSPLSVITGKWKPNTNRLDIVMAAYSGATAYVTQRTDDVERMKLAGNLWEATGALMATQLEDILLLVAGNLVKAKLSPQFQSTLRTQASPILAHIARSGLTQFAAEQA